MGAVKAISFSEMTALISDSLIRRGAELARRCVEIPARKMASKRMRCGDRICQPSSTRLTRIVAREKTHFCALRVRPVQTVAVSTSSVKDDFS